MYVCMYVCMYVLRYVCMYACIYDSRDNYSYQALFVLFTECLYLLFKRSLDQLRPFYGAYTYKNAASMKSVLSEHDRTKLK
jgi:hypothetical protein